LVLLFQVAHGGETETTGQVGLFGSDSCGTGCSSGSGW
jgi:hypothetical protein